MVSHPIFHFASAASANRLVAGVPAAARLARAWHAAVPEAPLVLEIADEGALTPCTEQEIARLAPGLVLDEGPAEPGRLAVSAESLPDPCVIRTLLSGKGAGLLGGDPEAMLRDAARKVIRATAKPGDGIVSRHLNRPLSQAASLQLLRLRWMRPGHATALTALIGLAMFAALLSGTPQGLIAGAVLFQIASVADGIDGEIARATFRTSASGAAWDSGVDAATNLGFILGTSVNLAMQGQDDAAMIGAAGLAILTAGMTLLGVQARMRGEPLHFDGAKRIIGARDTAFRRWLRYITMRDFYCLFLAVMVAAGLAGAALAIFTVAAGGWLVAVIVLLLRDRTA